MLVLTRRTGEEILIGDNIRIMVTGIRADRVRLGITAPQSIRVARVELCERPLPRDDAQPPRGDQQP